MIKVVQIGKYLILLCLIIEAVLLWAIINNPDGISFLGIFISNSIPLVILFLFYKMEVKVAGHNISIKFGVGLFRKTIAIQAIKAVKLTQNSLFVGWGIRYTPDYTLYNVGGKNAIELVMKNGQRSIRIGCDDPILLFNFLNSKISN